MRRLYGLKEVIRHLSKIEGDGERLVLMTKIPSVYGQIGEVRFNVNGSPTKWFGSMTFMDHGVWELRVSPVVMARGKRFTIFLYDSELSEYSDRCVFVPEKYLGKWGFKGYVEWKI